MRKFVKKLLDRTECVLGTGHSFLFVTNFEKKKGSITKLVGFRIPDIVLPAHIK